MKAFCCGVCVAVMALSIGCGPGSTPVEEPEGVTNVDLIVRDLESTVQNGQLGSEMMSIQNNLLKLEDQALAEELQADLEELQGLTGARAKAQAQEMIDKLE